MWSACTIRNRKVDDYVAFFHHSLAISLHDFAKLYCCILLTVPQMRVLMTLKFRVVSNQMMIIPCNQLVKQVRIVYLFIAISARWHLTHHNWFDFLCNRVSPCEQLVGSSRFMWYQAGDFVDSVRSNSLVVRPWSLSSTMAVSDGVDSTIAILRQQLEQHFGSGLTVILRGPYFVSSCFDILSDALCVEF